MREGDAAASLAASLVAAVVMGWCERVFEQRAAMQVGFRGAEPILWPPI